MDAFESLVGACLEQEGYWVIQAVKVVLTTDEKAELNKKSMPTPEIDLVAYHVRTNSLMLVEVKSFLDSTGVGIKDLEGKGRDAGRYKLLNDKKFQQLILEKLQQDFLKKGLINTKTKVLFGLAAGNVYKKDEQSIKLWLKEQGYSYFGPDFIRKKILTLKDSVYVNDGVTMTVKMLRPYLEDK